MERDKLIQQEAERRLRQRAKKGEKIPAQQIDVALKEERDREEVKVKEGEAWVESISGAIKMFNRGKPFLCNYVGFKDGRRTFEIEY